MLSNFGWALCFGLCAAVGCAHAARPMITDDARIVDPKACQVESWIRSSPGAPREYWAIPGCNPSGNVELSLGGAHARDGEQKSGSSTLVQAKTILNPLELNGLGIALAAGYSVVRDATGEPSTRGMYTYMPVSMSLLNDRAVMHVNIGAAQINRLWRATWGVGSEIQVADRLQVIVETYGSGRREAYWQGGLRFWVVPGRVQVDTTVGRQSNGGDGGRWFTVGLRLITPPFMN